MFTFDVDAEAVMLTDHPELIDSMDGVWVAAGDEIAASVETLDLSPVVHDRPILAPEVDLAR